MRSVLIICQRLSGIVLVVGSSACIILTFTWAGVPYAWVSPQVLIPLVLGFVGLVGFGFVERFYSKEPTVSLPSRGEPS